MTSLRVNGQSRVLHTHPQAPLLWALRDELGCASVKYGCGVGQCGACRVVIDGAPEFSCLVTIADAAARDVRTLEGFLADGSAEPIVDILLAIDAGQCGYCLPGIVTTLAALRARDAAQTRADVVRALDDHLCRCGSQTRILKAACAALGVDDD